MSGTSENLTPRTAARKISELQTALKEKETTIQTLQQKVAATGVGAVGDDGVVHRHHDLTSVQYLINDKGMSEQRKIGTRGSVQTASILDLMNNNDAGKTNGQVIAEKFVSLFQNPVAHAAYLQSPDFATDIMSICEEIRGIFEEEARCLSLQSPVYVFGDIHGNLEDLHFFSDNVWKLGIDLTAGNFLFLGDYVDRGLNCLEVVAYLFALKLLFPRKVFMLRGNHETRDVNSWVDHYRERSFLYQCQNRFDEELGEILWEEVNQVFDRLPLACIIDHELFCIHGGIPRLCADYKNEIECINAVPAVAGIMPPYKHETAITKQIGADCIWSDPASEAQEAATIEKARNPARKDFGVTLLDSNGFGASPRGGGVVCFGNQAIQNFLQRNNLSYIIRAHEAHAHGVAISKGARVFTVFSTSKDHRQGGQAMAGCILIDVDKIQVINRSPAYKNKYVHRLASISLQNISQEEMSHRASLGLIRHSVDNDDLVRKAAAEALARAEAGSAENEKNKREEQRRVAKAALGSAKNESGTSKVVDISGLVANQKVGFDTNS